MCYVSMLSNTSIKTRKENHEINEQSEFKWNDCSLQYCDIIILRCKIYDGDSGLTNFVFGSSVYWYHKVYEVVSSVLMF